MTRRDTSPKGTPCWLDLGTTDRERSIAFYTELFGWTAEDAGEEFGHYVNLSKDGVQVAGLMATDGPDGWAIYLATDDIAKVAELSPANDGGVVMPPMAVGELGQMAILSDAGGAMIGAWQPGQHAGFGVYAEPDVPGWFELHTRDWDGTLAYYREVFGADIQILQDSPEFRYAVFMNGPEEQVAGIMDASGFLPEGVPAHWSVYVQVADAGAAIEKATGLGATLVQGPDDTPYGVLVTLADPNGAIVKLQQPPAEG